MNHNEFVKTYAVERYFLGEMAEEERDRFEEHYFECPICLREMQTSEIFRANVRAHFAERDQAVPVARTAWGSALRPLYAVAAVLLLCLLGLTSYQNVVVIPGLQARLDAPRPAQTISLWAPTRGAELVVSIRSNVREALLEIDVGPNSEFYPRYRIECADQSGLKWTSELANPGRGIPLSVIVPAARLAPARYEISVYGLDTKGESLLNVYPLIVEKTEE